MQGPGALEREQPAETCWASVLFERLSPHWGFPSREGREGPVPPQGVMAKGWFP